MTAKNQDFVVKNGLQVTSNLVVGAYTGTASSQQIVNGAVISGAVGIGTANVIVGTQLQVANGNIRIASADKGLIFPDGTRQTTAATNTPSYGYQYTLQFAGAGNAFSGDSTNLIWSSTNATLQTNNITVTSSAAANGQDSGALQVACAHAFSDRVRPEVHRATALLADGRWRGPRPPAVAGHH